MSESTEVRKPSRRTLGKKKLCNPPVLAKIASAEALIEAGYLTDSDVRALIRYDEDFVSQYDGILAAAVKNSD